MSHSGWAFMEADAPFALRGPQFMLDTLWSGPSVRPTLASATERLHLHDRDGAERHRRYRLIRDEIDAFALRSHRHAARARDTGRLAKAIVPVAVPDAALSGSSSMTRRSEMTRLSTHWAS